MASERRDWAESQIAEIEGLRAVYFEEGAVRVDDNALQALAEWASGTEGTQLPAPLTLSVRIDHGIATSGRIRMAIVLPHSYPQENGEVPILWMELDSSEEGSMCSTSMNLIDDMELCADLQAHAGELASVGEECLLFVLERAIELARERLVDATSPSFSGQEDDDEALALALFEEELIAAHDGSINSSVAAAPLLGRRAFFSHHIIADSKRRAISDWALQLGLGGLAKIGWPGLIIVEGDEGKVRMYVEALSRLRWKHFVVRGEQTVDALPGQHLDDLRAMPQGFEEFGTDGMSQFAARCREYGLEELFLTCLKINPSNATSRGKTVAESGAAGSRRGKRK